MAKKTDLKGSCAWCGIIDCVNLFRHRDDSESIGGELYLYNQLRHPRVIDEDLGKYVCSNGVLLQCACFIVATLDELRPGDYLITISNEIVRDMKTSFYLAMSGHYRQAIVVQRCVLENFLYGLYFITEYFEFSEDDDERKEVGSKFRSWINGGFRKREEYLIDIIQKGRVISRVEGKRWKSLFDELSKFVHTIEKTPTGKAIKYKTFRIRTCYAEVEFDKEALAEWSKYYQSVFFLILFKLITMYPDVKKEDAGKLAFRKLRAEFRDRRKELEDPYLDEILKMRLR